MFDLKKRLLLILTVSQLMVGNAYTSNRLKKYCLAFTTGFTLIVSCLLLLSITWQSMPHFTIQLSLFYGVLGIVLGVGIWVAHEDFL